MELELGMGAWSSQVLDVVHCALCGVGTWTLASLVF